jgi:predicted nucleic acid-binding protein
VRILVDSSAWIDFLNGHRSRVAEQILTLLGSDEDLCTCGLIVTEVLQGLRRNSNFPHVVALFEDLTFLEPAGIATYLRAAEVYRQLRQQGKTVRSTIDFLIAALAEETSCSLLARERDLETIVASGLLRTSLVPATLG